MGVSEEEGGDDPDFTLQSCSDLGELWRKPVVPLPHKHGTPVWPRHHGSFEDGVHRQITQGGCLLSIPASLPRSRGSSRCGGGDASRQAPSPGPREGADMAHRRSGLWMGTWRDLHPGTRRARLTEQSPVQKTPGHTWGPGVWSRCCPGAGGRTDFCSVTLRQPGTTCKYTRASRRAPARLREGRRAVATEQSLAVTRKKRGGVLYNLRNPHAPNNCSTR